MLHRFDTSQRGKDTSGEDNDGDLEGLWKMSPITFSDVDNKIGDEIQ